MSQYPNPIDAGVGRMPTDPAAILLSPVLCLEDVAMLIEACDAMAEDWTTSAEDAGEAAVSDLLATAADYRDLSERLSRLVEDAAVLDEQP